MTDKELLENYVPIVHFLGVALGKNTEVVLNDLSQPHASVIAIANGFHSGRKVGSSVTDYAYNIMNSRDYKDKDYAIHYKGSAKSKTFVSSSFFIKNKQNKLIGMLCLNANTDMVRNFLDVTKKFIESVNFESIVDNNKPSIENLNTSVSSLVQSITTETLNKYNVSPKRMTKEEKVNIVKELAAQGILDIKGSVSEVASLLELSEPTIYRYMKQK